jgi:hypothetical protein
MEWDYSIGEMDYDKYDEINSILSDESDHNTYTSTPYQFNSFGYDDDVPF